MRDQNLMERSENVANSSCKCRNTKSRCIGMRVAGVVVEGILAVKDISHGSFSRVWNYRAGMICEHEHAECLDGTALSLNEPPNQPHQDVIARFYT